MVVYREERRGKGEEGVFASLKFSRFGGLLLAVCLMLVPATLHAQDAEPDLGTEQQRQAGQQVYLQKCAQCHGDEGAADGPAAAYVKPVPRDFTSGIFKFRTTASGELPTTEDLKRSIRKGMPYTSMPAWEGILSEQQITNLAYFIKTFNDDFAGPYGVPEQVEIPRAPGFDEDNIARGRQVFEENQCLDCHGQQGRGDGDSAPTLEDQWGNHIRPADMTKRWTFRNGQTRQDIYRTFTTGLDGSPMPSYDIPEEDRWALVDYVWSLSRDEPDYATFVIAHPVEGDLDVSQGAALFEEAEAAYFPVVGQIIEPGRSFNPGVNGIEVKVVYNADEIAFLLQWHDMTAEESGEAGPMLDAPDRPTDPDSTGMFADAVALQFPAEVTPGIEKPYMLFGDAKRPAEVWFAGLAAKQPQRYMARGVEDMEEAETNLDCYADYNEGQWTAVFKRQRVRGEGLSFNEATFVPVAFSVWDGFNRERGNRRGLTSWYHVYLEPMQTQSAAIPMLKWGGIMLLLELLVVGLVRWRHKQRPVAA